MISYKQLLYSAFHLLIKKIYIFLGKFDFGPNGSRKGDSVNSYYLSQKQKVYSVVSEIKKEKKIKVFNYQNKCQILGKINQIIQ